MLESCDKCHWISNDNNQWWLKMIDEDSASVELLNDSQH